MSEKPLCAVARDEAGIVVVTMQDEAGSNALGAALVAELTARLAEIGADRQAKVCVLCGLPGVFCSGGDKKMLLDLAQGRTAAADIMVSRAVLEVPVPTIAAMEGHAVGGGLTLGLCCDLVLLARQSSYGCNFMNLGFTPGMGTIRLLELAVGPFVAAEMMYAGQFFRGSQLEGRSGVNYVLPREKVAWKARQLAQRIAEKPRHALELLKRALSTPKRQAFEEARTTESLMHEICFARPETAQLIEENYDEPLPASRPYRKME
ncbi:MAG: enoyl-CoA hydratase/isomerase family protein [Deltaproteobacteria bacterium]|nr:enoyl-CoA hydratase/isomerase family protein [Deltaproteobacteria bacterium]